jgi:exopolyphosphatase/pppGpp-phosphohydrolase
MYVCRFCSDALATCSDTSNSSFSTCVFAVLIFAVKHLITSHPNLLGISAQMHGVGVPASSSQSHHHSHHIIMEIGMAASTTASNVIRISALRLA